MVFFRKQVNLRKDQFFPLYELRGNTYFLFVCFREGGRYYFIIKSSCVVRFLKNNLFLAKNFICQMKREETN